MEKLLKCKKSSEEFGSLDKMLHMERRNERVRYGKKKNLKCNVCGCIFGTSQNLMNHMRTHTGERPFKCEVNGCEMAFKQESALKNHIKVKHRDEHPFQCDFQGCLYIAKTSTYLILHKKVHSDERPFACIHSGCSFRAKRKDALSRHAGLVHNKSKSFTCSKCNFKTNSAQNLAGHMIVHEGNHEKIPCPNQGCGYKGTNVRALKEHMRHHKPLLPCPISGCGRAWYNPSRKYLMDHLKLHNPSGRPFQCRFGFKHFRTPDQLQQHYGTHTNEKPFRCGHCEFAAVGQGAVKAHISSVHTDVVFPFIVYLLDEWKCLRCKVSLPREQFLIHSTTHAVPVVLIGRLETRWS